MVAIVITPIRGGLPPWLGYGNGYGNGDGDGDGYGYGDGYGNGYGNGDGDGDGDGYGSYWSSTIAYFAAKWEPKQQKRLGQLREAGARLAFWRSQANGLPANGGGRIEPAAPGVVHTAPGPLSLCHAGTLHATLIPPKWKGERWWIVAMIGDVVGDDEKLGALTREIIGECL